MMSEPGSAKPLLLFLPFNQLSHYLRCIRLAHLLKKYFDIRFAYSADYEAFIAKGNFKTFPCHTINTKYVMQKASSFDFTWLSQEVLEQVYLAQVRVLSQLKPAVVIGDMAPTLKMAAEKTGITYISVINGYMSKYNAGNRSLSRTFPAYAVLKRLPASLLTKLINRGEQLTFIYTHRSFREMREKHGLSKTSYLLDEFEGDFTWIGDLPELFPQKPLPPHYHMIPPLFYRSNTATTFHPDKLDRGKRTMFVSMGSTGNWQQLTFLNDSRFSDFNIITAADKEGVLKGMHIIPALFVNADEVFPYTDLVICHGGNGTIYQALLYAIPVLCKTSHFEQEWNVQAVEQHGLGQSLDDINTPEGYRAVIESWITQKGNPALKAYADKIKTAWNHFPTTLKDLVREVRG